MHIAQGILKSINVNRLTKAGCVFKFWVADWFALLNNKMGGDLKKIRTVGLYMIEVWKAAGMDMDNVEFLWASDEINGHANEYWLRVMDIARKFNVPRVSGPTGVGGKYLEFSAPVRVASRRLPGSPCAARRIPSPLPADRALLSDHGPQGGRRPVRCADLLPLHAVRRRLPLEGEV